MQPSPSLLTVAWSMNFAACLMLGGMSLVLLLRSQRRTRYLLAAMMAFAAGASAMAELALARAPDIPTYEAILRLQVLLYFVIVVSLVWFVHAYFGTASRPLGWLITALWLVHVGAHLMLPGGAVFAGVTSLETVMTPWGEPFTLARGEISPWKWPSDLASLLVVVYIAHASVGAWRGGERRRAVAVGGSALLFIVLAGIHTPLVDAGMLRTPYLLSFAFLAIVAAMTYQLVDEALEAGRFARELDATERRWQSLLEKLPLLVVQRDTAGDITYANPAMLEASGYPAGELVGRHFSMLVPNAETERALSRFHRALQDEAVPPDVVQLRTRDGGLRDVAWSTVRLQDAEGRTVGALSTGLDLTEQVRAQAELVQMSREMELLSRATLLGEIAAGLAHELNQPLAAILSNAQAARRLLAVDPPDLDELREIVGDIIADDKRAGNVVHGLRAMLVPRRADAEHASVGKAVRDAAQLLTSELKAAGVRVELALDPQADRVRGDTPQIQQVVMNLMLNAVRAMRDTPAGRREITIRSACADGMVVVEVADLGTGIDGGTMQRMFEPFVTTRQAGLGMGLAICRRLVDGFGGRIWAENRPGGGAVLSFSLPLADEPQPVSA